MSDTDTREVLRGVTLTMERLSFDLSAIWLLRDGRFRLETSSTDVVGDDDLEPDDGIAGRALATSSTVIVEDYASADIATPSGLALGLRGVVATPIRVRGEVAGILAGGLHRPWSEVDHPLVNVTELLAANAGRALELAGAVEEEQRTVAELRRLDRLKDDFISTVSHEMRTPLAVMLGSVETVLARWDAFDDALRIDLLERAARSGHALNGVIQTLLDFRKLEQGSFAYRPRQTRLDTLVDRILDRLDDLLIDHRVVLELSDTSVNADPDLLERVIENLLVNAARHTPAGTTVTIRAEDDAPAGVLVTVEDDGPGVADDEVDRLAERFFRGGDPNTRDTRGVGLGLALVTELLELHGSELTVASQLGAGARFGFHLPGPSDTTHRSPS